MPLNSDILDIVGMVWSLGEAYVFIIFGGWSDLVQHGLEFPWVYMLFVMIKSVFWGAISIGYYVGSLASLG